MKLNRFEKFFLFLIKIELKYGLIFLGLYIIK